MRTFAQKPQADAKATSAKPATFHPAHDQQSRAANPIQRLQDAMGNQRALQPLEANAAAANRETTRGRAFAGFDFSRISVHPPAPGKLQTKLKLGAPGDVHEQEADRVADQVMRMPEPQAPRPSAGGYIEGRNAQDSHARVLTKRAQANDTPGAAAPPIVHEVLRSPGQPLDPATRNFMEPRFAHDFSRVRVHADSKSAEMADALNARAFTVGSDIYFGRRELQPRTAESYRLLAHELAHVGQQSRMGVALQSKLKITGKPADVARAMTLLNSGMQMFSVSVDNKSGAVSIAPTRVLGPPTPEQQALADRLTTVINDPKDVIMTVSSGSKTIVGNYATGDFDIADVEAVGVSALVHEIVEQYQKQVKGQGFGTPTTGAHGEAIKAEAEVGGATHGTDKAISMTRNADGTVDAVIETPYTYPDGKVKTMVMTLKRSNIVSITWK
jgi:hypothetical protein